MSSVEVLVAATQRLSSGASLDAASAAEAARALVPAEVPAETKAAFLRTLADRGETASEVRAFATVFRGLARRPDLGARVAHAIDVCGTGGSHTGRTNVSTMVAFVLASLGVPVVKHGNRSATSKSGSADFLEALGFPLAPPEERLRAALDELGFCFLFAPGFHPAFKEIGPVRRALAAEGRRSIFNLLGPLINPVRPPHQLLGVFDPAWTSPMAAALEGDGFRAGLVVTGPWEPGRWVDELTSAGPNVVAPCGEEAFRAAALAETFDARAHGWKVHPGSALAGGTAAENAAELREMARGGGREAVVEDVSLNAGAALWMVGEADSWADGRQRARSVFADGTLSRWLDLASRFHS